MAQPELDQSKEEMLRMTALQFALEYSKTHVAAQMCDYMPDVASDILEFLKGEYVPFDERDEGDVTERGDNVIHVDFGKKGPDETA